MSAMVRIDWFNGSYILEQNGIDSGLEMSALYILSVVL